MRTDLAACGLKGYYVGTIIINGSSVQFRRCFMYRKMFLLLGLILMLVLPELGCGQKKDVPVTDSSPQGAISGSTEIKGGSRESLQNVFGMYVGSIDGNFIEISPARGSAFPEAGQNLTLLVPDSQKGLLGQLKKGDRVEFSCFKNSRQQWELTGLKAAVQEVNEGKPRKIEESDFALNINGGTISLGAWDRDLDLPGLMGGPFSEKTEKLGAGADTFKGSYKKSQFYNDLELGMMSPRDNGKAFFIDRIVITGSRYVTARGIKAGDGYQRILEEYDYVPRDWETAYDRQNHDYTLSDGSTKFITYEVKNGIIKSITLFIEHP